VKYRRVRAAADDGVVGRPRSARAAEGVLDERLYLVLPDAGARGAHGLAVCLRGDVRRALHERDLFVGLNQAHLVEERAGVCDGLRRVRLAPAERAHVREAAYERLIQVGVAVAESVVERARAVEQFRELRVELIDGESLVRAVALLRALYARASARPRLLLLVARPHEERVARLARGRDDGDGVGLVEARQVVEVGVLPEAVLRVVRARRLARRRYDGDGVRPHSPHELRQLRSSHLQSPDVSPWLSPRTILTDALCGRKRTREILNEE
jgi:hypothetical protein